MKRYGLLTTGLYFFGLVAAGDWIGAAASAQSQPAKPAAASSPETSDQFASETNEVFKNAWQYALERTVKVYGATAGRVAGYASGIVVSPDGKIVTMQGVFLEGRHVRVTLPDGSTHTAAVLRRDRQHQIALLQIDASTPKYFDVDPAAVGQKGDWILALSNAFKVADGAEPLSLNVGVISLRTSIAAYLNDRDVAYKGPLVLLDTITSNPGAAGGAVVTVDHRLVGVIGKVINSSETNTRLNYCVPTSVISQLIDAPNSPPGVSPSTAEDDRRPGDLGIKLFTLGGRRAPAYIDRVRPGSPAAEAGLKPDDLVVRLAGAKINSVAEFQQQMKSVKAGDEVIVVVTRKQQVIRIPLEAIEKQ